MLILNNVVEIKYLNRIFGSDVYYTYLLFFNIIIEYDYYGKKINKTTILKLIILLKMRNIFHVTYVYYEMLKR